MHSSAMEFIVLFMLLSSLHQASGLEFQFPNFNNQSSNITSLKIVSQNWYDTGPDAAFQNSELWLTQLYNVSTDTTNLGRVIYTDPVDFSNITFFQTSFTFKIVTTRPYGTCGSGMAFFISPSTQAPNNSDSKGAMGLVNPLSSNNSNFFAVEFDTRESVAFHDPSSSHMGINVNSMASLSLADSSPNGTFYPELFLYNNYTFAAWVEYNCTSRCVIQVWMTNDSSALQRPAQPCMNLTYDLSTVFKVPAYLGFSATSAPAYQGAEAHIVYSWNFTSGAESTTVTNVTNNSSSSVPLPNHGKCWICQKGNVNLILLLSILICLFI